jgi:cytochrome c oxidase cbb3-type subunit 2
MPARLNAQRTVGVPYTSAEVANAIADLEAQADPFAAPTGLHARYGPKVALRDFDGDPTRITEMDALVAYLQMLGTLVDFRTYQADSDENRR